MLHKPWLKQWPLQLTKLIQLLLILLHAFGTVSDQFIAIVISLFFQVFETC
jgi:hypothetical protein